MIYASAPDLLRVLAEQGFQTTVPVDVDEVARRLGISVESSMDIVHEGYTGDITFKPGGGAVVRINPFENSYEPRRRFTLAHEIGHFCLHSNDDRNGFVDSRKTMSRSATYWDTKEAQANNFAAQLLMPRSLIADVALELLEPLMDKDGNVALTDEQFISQMAEKFEVSNPAMRYRLQALGIVK